MPGAYVFAPKIEPTPDPSGGECMGCDTDIPRGGQSYEFDNWRYCSLKCAHVACREAMRPKPREPRIFPCKIITPKNP